MDRTAIVTGGTGGLGTAVVEALLSDGWRVVVPWVVQHELARVDQERPGIELVHADLADPMQVAEVARVATARAGEPLRGVANLVGGYGGSGRVADQPIEDFEAQLRLNLRPTYLVTQAALPHLVASGGGSVVCVSSRAAERPFAGASGYIVGKAGVIAFARAVAAEYLADGVRCNAILPSVIDTPANRAKEPDADHDRWVKPADIAGVVRWLLSAESAPTSGAALPVYGRA
jgi:NAD(P)-dependent dehydrogenase (short-subunit alcohol dehydrogenase family)